MKKLIPAWNNSISGLYYNYQSIWEVNDNNIKTLSLLSLLNVSIETDKKGNIYITKGKSDIYPCFVCHLDTVFKDKPRPVLTKNNVLFSSNGNGIGGDDKCGIIACLELLKRNDKLKIVMFVQEESGGQGAQECQLDFFKDCSCVIEIDRKGKNEFIQTSGGTKLCTEDFKKIFLLKGYKENQGIFSDINILTDNKVGICCCNISAGYYNAHSSDEYVMLSELFDTIQVLTELLQEKSLYKKWEYISEDKYFLSESYWKDTKSIYGHKARGKMGYFPDMCDGCTCEKEVKKYPELGNAFLCDTCADEFTFEDKED